MTDREKSSLRMPELSDHRPAGSIVLGKYPLEGQDVHRGFGRVELVGPTTWSALAELVLPLPMIRVNG
jgi:hypothetical protein